MLTAHYVMIGGFLGAGKTTSILRLAKHFASEGKRVGLIANDQSQGLVDTAMFSSSGLPTQEIAGGCFCCKFNSLIEACDKLDAQNKPEIYLAEPVGSCTDLVATVVLPLQQLHPNRYRIAPLSVLVDPIRAQRFLGLLHGKSFSEKVNYIYDRQLEEADLIIVNKSDLLSEAQLQELMKVLETRYPSANVLSICARTGAGFDSWIQHITQTEIAQNSPRYRSGGMPVDYERYAEGEALLGWVNLSVKLRGAEFDGNHFLKQFLKQLHTDLRHATSDSIAIAHLKGTLIPDVGNDLAIANLVREDGQVESSFELDELLEFGDLIINLRAEADPEVLQSVIRESLRNACLASRLSMEQTHLAAFRPLPPTPTHRISG